MSTPAYAGANHVPVRIVTPKGRSGEANTPPKSAQPILTRLEDYFGIPFPYEKFDQVSVPITGDSAPWRTPGWSPSADIILADPASDTLSRQRSFATDAATNWRTSGSATW